MDTPSTMPANIQVSLALLQACLIQFVSICWSVARVSVCVCVCNHWFQQVSWNSGYQRNGHLGMRELEQWDAEHALKQFHGEQRFWKVGRLPAAVVLAACLHNLVGGLKHFLFFHVFPILPYIFGMVMVGWLVDQLASR